MYDINMLLLMMLLLRRTKTHATPAAIYLTGLVLIKNVIACTVCPVPDKSRKKAFVFWGLSFCFFFFMLLTITGRERCYCNGKHFVMTERAVDSHLAYRT